MTGIYTRAKRWLSPPFVLFLCFAALGLAPTAEAQTLRVENLTKVPGSSRSFPADDWFTFQRSEVSRNSRGTSIKASDRSKMRLHNTGSRTLVITKLTTSNVDNFSIRNVSIPSGGLKIEPGRSVDAEIVFRTSGDYKRLVTEQLVIESNATNRVATVTLRGALQKYVEGGNEINTQEILQSFGFETRLGTRDNYLVVRPSSLYPSEEDVNAGLEGDLIVSRYFVQADPSKPVQVIQMSALHGPGTARTTLLTPDGQDVGIRFTHGDLYHNTLLPRATNTSTAVAGASVSRINGPFYVNIDGYTTVGGVRGGSKANELLALRSYLAIDRNGRIIPNEYIINMDYIGTKGCGEGSANCDWNDNTLYLVNVRPADGPTAREISNVTTYVNKPQTYAVNGSFERGYAGNRLTYTANILGGGSVPSWIKLDRTTGAFSLTAPASELGKVYNIEVNVRDPNGRSAKSNFSLLVDDASVGCSVAANADGKVKVLDCATGRVKLSGKTSTGIYRWSGPNGFTSTDNDPEVTAAGTYVLTSGSSCSRTSIVEVYPRGACEGGSNDAPTARASASIEKGNAPLLVVLDGSASSDKDGRIVRYEWAWKGGQGSGAKAELVFPKGKYEITLTVTDDRGATDTDKVTVEMLDALPARNTEYWLEAECAEVGTTWKVVKDARASGGTYLNPTGKSGSTAPADIPANRVRFVVNNAEAGKFGLYARIETLDGASDSYWIRVNNGSWYNWQQGFATDSRGFNWIEKSGNPLQFRDGTNTVDIAFREPNTRLDKIHLDKQYDAPFGLGAPATNCGGVEPDAPAPKENIAPTARISTSTTRGEAPLRVDFDGRASSDPDGSIVSYRWTWKGGESTGERTSFVFSAGNHDVTLTVTDNQGASNKQTVRITATEVVTPTEPGPTEATEYWLEAECAQVGSTWSTEQSSSASNGGYAVVRGFEALNSPPANVTANYVRFSLANVTAGDYQLFARIAAASKLSDSYWVRINGGTWYKWYSGIASTGSFVWNRYPNAPAKLRNGKNTVDFAFRESGTKLDKILITDGTRAPTGTGIGGTAPSCTIAVNNDVTVEAECATVGSGWKRFDASTASNGTYVTVVGDRNETVPTSDVPSQQLVFNVTAKERATYHLFLRMNAPTNGRNSVWVKIDGGAWIKFWEEIGGAQLSTRGFEWRKVNNDGRDISFPLDAGTHIIRIANRESFTEIDKLHLSKRNSAPSGFGDLAADCTTQQLSARNTSVASSTVVPAEELAVFPNPTADRLHLTLVSAFRGRVELTVIDLTGRQLLQQPLDKQQDEMRSDVDVSRLPAGMYYLRVIEGEQQSVKPFVKR